MKQGTNARHNRIAGALFARLHAHVHRFGCEAFIADMKVRADAAVYYPDVVVTCEAVAPDALYLDAPTLIAEVPSGSTESRDRLEKWAAFRALPSLREYVLVAQDRMALEIFRRRDAGWDHLVFEGSEEVEFTSVKMKVMLQELYP